MKQPTLISILALLIATMTVSSAFADMTDAEMLKLLEELDDRQRNSGDYKALVYIEQKENGKDDLLYESVIYRRDEKDELVILFLRPKSDAGKGYLRIDKNLFFFDPVTDNWERRTERESIGGTNSRRSDFDESRLAEEYTAAYVAEENLGRFTVHHLRLSAKEGVDVAYPVLELWVDSDTRNVLKRQEFALSGTLMRTSYYPKWERMFSQSKQDHVYFPKEIRVFDEVEKGNATTIVLQEVALDSLDSSIFTKAWLEERSR